MASPRDLIAIEIVYAQPQRAIVKSLRMAQGSLVGDALAEAARDTEFLGADLANAPVGIFGKLARREQALNDGDRIEIYRPLLQEPKAARRTRSRA
jgi:putative ubiquitin-RnfH superfamily antitoxin RatB of RatAB toxin-antitoxin module